MPAKKNPNAQQQQQGQQQQPRLAPTKPEHLQRYGWMVVSPSSLSTGDEKQKKGKEQSSASSSNAKYNNLIPELAEHNPFTVAVNLDAPASTPLSMKRNIIFSIQQFFEEGIPAVLWDCEIVLMQYLLLADNRERFRDRSIVELGAGLGLCALVATRVLGARVSLATDLGEVVEHLTVPTLIANGGNPITTSRKDGAVTIGKPTTATTTSASASVVGGGVVAGVACAWGVDEEAEGVLKVIEQCRASSAAASSSQSGGGGVDFIIAGDVIYHSDQHEILLRTILRPLTARKTTPQEEGEKKSGASSKAGKNKNKGNSNAESKKSRFVFVHRQRNENDSNFIEELTGALEVVKKTNVADIFPDFPKRNVNVYELELSSS